MKTADGISYKSARLSMSVATEEKREGLKIPAAVLTSTKVPSLIYDCSINTS